MFMEKLFYEIRKVFSFLTETGAYELVLSGLLNGAGLIDSSPSSFF